MAGHSKWANIKHRKSRQDAKRGKEFTKIIREITASVKHGGDGMDNSRLRQAIDKGLAANMPRATIDRAIKRGVGNEEGVEYQEVVYEGYGPGGSAVYIEVLTDNKNRAVAEIRHALTKSGGNLGAAGCAAHLFDKLGVVEVQEVTDEEKLLSDALEAGATEMEEAEDGNYYIQTEPADIHKLRDALTMHDYKLGNAEVTMLAKNQMELDSDGLDKISKLYDALEDLDDVQNVYCNVALDD